ncbi:MAG: hypothetical protein J6Y26_05075 [Lachnospiraceae bacterium]|nr:hypothetical protein [Lachnospiraceae bacterium]
MQLIDYSQTSTWNAAFVLGIIAVMVLAAIYLRRYKLFHKSLLPTAVLGGFLMLIVKLVGVKAGIFHTDHEAYIKFNNVLQVLTYHGIAVGFIAMSLRTPSGDTKKGGHLVGPKSGAIIVSSYMIQGLVGLTISLVLSYTVMPKLFRASGILLPMGYGQGPGQANNFGTTFEELGFAGGHSFGLAIAAAGYLSACIVGVIYLNYLSRKGRIKRGEYEPVAGSVTVDNPDEITESTASESLDRLSLQLAIVMGIYLATSVLTRCLTEGIGAISEGAKNAVGNILWGFNFMVGSALAIAVRAIFRKRFEAKPKSLQKQDNYLLSRISGLAFDAMIVAGIGSIELEQLAGLWVPFLLMAVAGAAVTFLHLRFVCRRVYSDYYNEGMLSMYGMMTGTISSGVILLREIDPQLKTPAANNLIIGSSYAILLGAILMVFVGMAPKSDVLTFVTFGLILIYYIILMLFICKAGRKAEKEPEKVAEETAE